MAYVYPWDPDTPVNGDPANGAASDQRITKHAIEERLEGTLIVDMTADPTVAVPAILGNVDDKILYYHWTELNWVTEPSGSKSGFEIRTSGLENCIGYAVVKFPDGVTVTQFRGYLEGDGSNNSTISLRSLTYTDPPTETVIATLTRSDNTMAEEAATGLSEVINNAAKFYIVRVQLVDSAGGDAAFAVGKIIYDTPDCRNTI